MSDAFADLIQALPPERLVPGDPDGGDQLAQSLLRFSEVLADAAHALNLVDLIWVGDAADAFENEFHLQPTAFKTAATAFHDAGYALGSYAISLDSARQAAEAAAAVFQRGVRAAHDAHAAASAAIGGLLPTSGPLDLRTEPAGLQDRLTGTEKLDTARHQLDRAGTDAARTLREAMALAPRQVTPVQHAANFFATDPTSLLNKEKLDFAAGGARAAADLAVLGATVAMPTPASVLRMNHLEAQLDDLEWTHGANPRSGWHTGGSIIIPAAATYGIHGLVARAGSTAPRIVATDIPPKGINVAPSDLSAFGNKSAPRAPRLTDMKVGTDGMLVPQRPPEPIGASTFADPSIAPLKGHFHTISEGTEMPRGLAVVRDGTDVGGPNAPTHATIYATEPMPPEVFAERFLGLAWKYGGRK